MTFNFSDNGDAPSWTNTWLSSHLIQVGDVCTGSTQSSCSYQYKWDDAYSGVESDPIETATVSGGGMSGSASSNYFYENRGSSYTADGYTSSGTFGGFVPYTRRHCSELFGVTLCDGPWPIYTRQYRAYSAYSGTLVPEPATLTLLSLGLGMMGWRAGRHKIQGRKSSHCQGGDTHSNAVV